MTVRIGSYIWNVMFVPKEKIDGNDGQTRCNDFLILIRDDLDRTTQDIILRHEIVHALLDTQGRVYQQKFDLEEVCEFVAWKLPEINQIMEEVHSANEGNYRQDF